jgi:hypothetical protein
MNLKTLIVIAVGMSVAVSGCSSRPRAFAPQLAAPPADPKAFEQANAECSHLLVAGKLDQNGKLASAAGVAGYGGMAVVAATVVLLPVAIVGGAIGMAKIKRAKKEKAIKTAMYGCLKERGYQVNGWTRMPKSAAGGTNSTDLQATPG